MHAFCGQCGTAATPGARFCGACGTAHPAPVEAPVQAPAAEAPVEAPVEVPVEVPAASVPAQPTPVQTETVATPALEAVAASARETVPAPLPLPSQDVPSHDVPTQDVPAQEQVAEAPAQPAPLFPVQPPPPPAPSQAFSPAYSLPEGAVPTAPPADAPADTPLSPPLPPAASSTPPSGPAAPAVPPPAAGTAGAVPGWDALQLSLAARPAVLALLPALAVLTVLVAVGAQLVLPDEHGGGLADWLRTAVGLLAAAVGAGFVLSGEYRDDDGSAELAFGWRALPLALTAVLFVLTARQAAKAEREAPSPSPARALQAAGVAGVAGGLVLALLVLMSRSSSAYGYGLARELDLDGARLTAGWSALGALLGGALLVGAASLVGRLRAAGRLASPPLPPAVERQVPEHVRVALAAASRLLLRFSAGVAAAVAALGLLAGLWTAFLTDELDGSRLQALGVAVVTSLNAVGTAVLVTLGVPLAFSSSGTGSGSVFGFGGSLDETVEGSVHLLDDPRALLALLVPVLVALVVTVRSVLHRPDAAAPLAGQVGVRTAAALGAAGALGLALLLRVTFSAEVGGSLDLGSVSGEGEGAVGPSLLWAPLLGAAWGAALVLLLRAAPTVALTFPGLARRTGGAGAAPSWTAALTGQAPAPAGAASPLLRRAGQLAGAGVAAVVLVLGGAWAVNSVVYTPEATAREYLEALGDGDLDAALALLSSPPDTEGQPLLEEDVAQSDDVVLLDDVEVVSSDGGDGYASVEVRYAVDGVEQERSLSLSEGEERFGLLRTWEVDAALPTLTVAESAMTAAVGGVALPAGEHLALPGRYTLRAQDHPLLSADPVEVLVGGDGYAEASLTPAVTPAVDEAVDAAVSAALTRCVGGKALPLVNCPFLTSTSYPEDLRGVRMSLLGQPSWEVAYDPEAAALRVQTVSEGELRLLGTQRVEYFFGPPQDQPYDNSFSFTVDASVAVDGEEAELVFDE